MQKRGSVTALVLYIIGGTTVFISLFLTTSPTVESFTPGLLGLLLGTIILALGRITAHLSRIQDVLEGRR